MSTVDVFAPAQSIADAVLYEGYVLYPYRASADKNRLRWQWGIIGPEGSAADGVGEEPTMATDLVAEPWGGATLRLRLRFLRVVARRVEREDGAEGWSEVDSVTIGEDTWVSFDDAEERRVEAVLALDDASAETTAGFSLEERTEAMPLGALDGAEHRLVRHREALSGELAVRAEPVDGGRAHLVHVAVTNTTPWPGGDRDEANLRSLIGAHVLGAADRGLFVSTLDPPDEHADAVARCRAQRLWPVLVGAERRAPLVLASPVILYDQPEIAPESQTSFYDGTEIDELLSLRVMTMTEAEKAEARATDPRAAAIVDGVEDMDASDLASLHGNVRSPEGRPPATAGDAETAIPTILGDGTIGDDPTVAGTARETGSELTGGRPWWDPGVDERFNPDTDGVVVAGEAISRGSVVRLHPGKRADAHDIFFRDRDATVAAIIHDVDGSIHVAVTIDDDPGADLNDATGRYFYFSPDEVEPLRRRVQR